MTIFVCRAPRSGVMSKANLTSLAGAPPSLQPNPYVRHDGVSAVGSYSAGPANLRRSCTTTPTSWSAS